MILQFFFSMIKIRHRQGGIRNNFKIMYNDDALLDPIMLEDDEEVGDDVPKEIDGEEDEEEGDETEEEEAV